MELKCYRIHPIKGLEASDGDIGFWTGSQLTDAITIYNGYAVCEEHLEELQESQFTPSGEPYQSPMPDPIVITPSEVSEGVRECGSMRS